MSVLVEREINPNQSLRVQIESSGTFRSEEKLIFVVTAPTIGFQFTMTYPEDLLVSASLLHPDFAGMRPDSPADSRTVKQWRTIHELLPYQGIELEWRQRDMKV